MSPREWTDPKPSWKKKLNVLRFQDRVPCPYCAQGMPSFVSNLGLARHVLSNHNWDHSAERVALTREGLLELILKHLGSKNPDYPDSSSMLKQFEALATEIAEAYS